MARFRKVILRPGTYRIPTSDGPKLFPVTKSYIKEVVDTARAMKEAGFNIPAPAAHRDDTGISPAPTKDKKNLNFRSDLNLGFWESFEQGLKGELIGYVDVPDEESAKKMGKTILETSVRIEPNWEDALGRTWKKALKHVALVTNPVEPNQTNFEQVVSEDLAIAMSFSMADEVGGSGSPGEPSNEEKPDLSKTDQKKDTPKTTVDGDEEEAPEANISEICTLLKDKLGFELPGDTTIENFIDRLRTVLVSIPEEGLDEELEDEKVTKKPKDSEVQQPTTPVQMSEDMKDNQDNLVLIEKKANSVLNKFLNELKASFKGRVQAAIEAGKIGKKYAKEVLFPEIDALVMSYEDLDENGEYTKPNVEIRLEMAEQMDSILDRVGSENPGNVEAKDDESLGASKEDLEEVYKSFI